MDTPFGYECDVALGGHNGTDTSHYAKKQSERFQRYRPFEFLDFCIEQHLTNVLSIIKIFILLFVLRTKFLSGCTGPESPVESTAIGQAFYWRAWELQIICSGSPPCKSFFGLLGFSNVKHDVINAGTNLPNPLVGLPSCLGRRRSPVRGSSYFLV